MKKLKIIYVPKSEIHPAFGYAYPKNQNIKIRNDLPNIVKRFVLEHEKYHLKDFQKLSKKNKKYNWVLGEIKANIYGTIKHPIGAFVCGVMSLQPYRLKFYFQRFLEKK